MTLTLTDTEKLINIPFKKRTNCIICGAASDEPLIELPNFPLTGIYTGEKITTKIAFADQNFHLCTNCGHGQISNIIDPDILYDSTYCFRTSASKTAIKANDIFLSFINRTICNRHFKNIVEIGCNDLYLLNSLSCKSEQLIGIDPILKDSEHELSNGKFTIIGQLFENINLKDYAPSHNTLVLCSHTLEHIDNPRTMLKKLFDYADDSTLFFFQFPGLEALVDNCRFDRIFHQHLNYISLSSFIYLLNELGGELIDYAVNPHHWGSLLVAFKKAKNKIHNPSADTDLKKISPAKILKNYTLFKSTMQLTAEYLETIKDEMLFGYGAAQMLPVLSYHLRNDFSAFDCILDDDPAREGLFYINLPVCIKSPNDLNLTASTIVITAQDNSRQILPKAVSLNPKRIILPISNI
jgi:cyclopropane-fatty-acyl-phospholipid synthase